MTKQEFSSLIKEKYPSYKNVPDDELVKTMLEKYPSYKSQITEDKKSDGIIKSIVKPFASTAVTGLAAVQDTYNLARGNKDAISRTKVGYNVPGLGQVLPQKIGEDIEIKGDEIVGGGFGKNTLKTIGTGLEVGSWFAPGTGALAKTAVTQPLSIAGKEAAKRLAISRFMQGAAQSGGAELQKSGELSKAILPAAIGGGISFAIGKGMDKLGAKYAEKAAAKSKVLTEGAESTDKYVDDYLSAMGMGKKLAKKEAQKAAGKIGGNDPREVVKSFIEDGIVLEAKNDGGRSVFNTVPTLENLNKEFDAGEDALQEALSSMPNKKFSYISIAENAKDKVRSMPNVVASEKKRMMRRIDDLIAEQIEAEGKQVTGSPLNQFKRGLYDLANYERQTTGNDRHIKMLANAAKEAIEDGYKDTAEIATLNSRLGRLAQQRELLIDLNGKVVHGGRLPKMFSKGVGMAIGSALPLPIPGIKEYAGAEIGGKLHDAFTDPARLTGRVVQGYTNATKGIQEPGLRSMIPNSREALLSSILQALASPKGLGTITKGLMK